MFAVVESALIRLLGWMDLRLMWILSQTAILCFELGDTLCKVGQRPL